MNTLIGTWRLLSVKLQDNNGNISYPLGKQIKGLLIYQNDGYMSGIIAATNRPLLSSPALLGLSDIERLSISKNFNAYAGKFTIKEDIIIHDIKVSFVPNLMANYYHKNSYSVSDDILNLTSRVSSDKEKSILVTWKRIIS